MLLEPDHQQDLQPWRQGIRELPRQSLKSLIGIFPSSAEGQNQPGWSIIWLQLGWFVLITTVIGIVRANLRLDTLSSTVVSFAAPFLFVLFTGFQYLLAKVFGGEGSFKQHLFYALLFFVPSALLVGSLSLLPLPMWVREIIDFYNMGLNFVAIQAVHRLSNFRTGCLLFAPGILVALVLLVLFLAMH